MRKRRRALSLRGVLFLTVLFFLLLVPLLFPALGSPDAQGYDFVDNNTSNVDGVSDIGMHSNFTAQQYGPDSIYDTLTEENTGGVGGIIEDFVDQQSDVDSSSDIGTHSEFTKQKAKDSDYDTLTEETIGGDFTPMINVDFATQPIDGDDVGWEWEVLEGQPTLQWNSSIKAFTDQVDAGDSSTQESGRLYQSFTYEAGMPVYGDPGFSATLYFKYRIVNVAATGNASDVQDLALVVRLVAPTNYENTYEQFTEGGSNIFYGTWGRADANATGWVSKSIDISSYITQAGYDYSLQFDTTLDPYSTTDEGIRWDVDDAEVWITTGMEESYQLDLEVQFITIIDFLPTEKLCIYAGTLGAEDIRVDYWNGTDWENLATDLTMNSWNNYTVSLTSTTFTIRFKGGNEIGDTTQDQWQIDATLLRVEGAGGKEDAVDNDTSNLDFSPDCGTLNDFDNMKTKDGMAILTEGLSLVWSNNSQPSALILETDPDISGSAATYETYGLNNLASDDSTYGGGDVQDCGTVNDPQEVSLIMEFDYSGLGISGSDISYLRFEGEVYFIGGTGRAPTNDPWEMETTFYNGSVDVYNWDSGSWEIMGTVFIDDPNDLSIWDYTGDTNPERPLIRSKDSSFLDAHMNASGYIRIRIQMTGVFQGTAYDGCSVIDYVDVDLLYGGGDDYLLDQEVQWTDLPHQLPNEELCIYGGTMGSEDIKVEAWNGTGWETVFTDLSSGWNNESVTDWLTGSIFTIRFKGANESGDTTQDQWQIDIALVHVWTAVNYELDLEVQWTNATYTQTHEELCIYGGTMGSENILVDVWTGSTWQNLFTDLSSGWNNISVTDYLVESIFTIRFKGGTETGDTSQDTWQIDCTLLHTWGVPPVADFSLSPEYPYQGDTVTFNASASYDPDGVIVSYFWDFGDGANATGEIATHIYADDGNYTVTLTVTDNDGLSDTTSKDITVLNRPPIATFTESAETVYTGEVITFNASDSYDSDGSIVSYFWDFGDGTNTTGVIVDHSYADDGNYTVTLTVTDDDGATDTATATKTIMNRPPVASFTESATTVFTGEVIYFDASDSYDPDGSIVSYFWDFGDYTNATGVVVEHAYADDGNYTVTLTVTDDDGATDSATATKTALNRSPVASFTESAEIVYTDETIYFNASASYDPDGSIISYWWDFGDGTNATSMTTEHSYPQEGNYTVTLTVTDNDGATSSTSASKTVLNRPPVALFTESAEIIYTNETIHFNATESYDPDGTIVSYFWDFGDGTNATGVTVEHSYTENGNYSVTLTVTDDDGATDTASATKIVLNRLPVASFTESAETVYTGEIIQFNASQSYDQDGMIVSYFWDFGDGSNASGVTVDHAYADDGNYTVTLTVTDDDGATDTATATKTVMNRPPVASFTESATTVLTGEVIYFDASSSNDSDGTIVSYFWDFGDGTNATGVTVEHAYADDGNYTVTLTVTDDDGAKDTATSTKTVLNRPPVALFTESAETVYTEEVIYFNASASYDPDGPIVSYFWDFGDGTNATGITAEHSYSLEGNYTVTLTVTDDDGATASTSAVKTVLNRPPVAMFTESAETVYTGETITFNASDSHDPDGYIVSYFWDFGDGTNATGVVVEHSYVDDGIYTVTLTVTDDDEATASTTATKTILNRPPIASFTESAETVLTSEVITFNASGSYDQDGYIANYFWDFGDGTNATGVVVEHAYADDGNYTVTLTVTDDDGATASSSATKTVLNRPPVASFTESATTVLTDEVIQFNASASYDQDGAIISYFWDFGDGTNASGVILDHSYADNGNYTVTLTVTDDDGATDTATSTKTVLNRPPVAIFTESAETVVVDETIYFNASASYDPDGSIVSYFWDFGDGTNATGVTTEHAYADNGVYTVTLTITDDDGATASTTATKMVEVTPPVAVFTESAETVYTDEIIYFNASDSYDPDGTIVSYFWDFGDGTNATDVTAEHAYVDDGNYTVTLTVTDDDGATDTATSTKTVLNRPPVASFTETAETVYTGEIITFNASDSHDPDGYIVSYLWNFGDGTNATGVVVGYAYADDGNYTVTLTVTDDDGATDTATSTKTVLNRAPVASFSESAESVLTGEVIYFNASASYDPDGAIVSYVWDFGDGTNATGVIVEHAYPDDGVYNVTLTATDDDGATASASATKTVLNRPPVASFTESATTVLTGEVITFNASASYDPDGAIISYFWDFGDGTNTTGVSVEHSYVDDGNYTVTLTLTDDDGATASTSAVKTVLNRPPVAMFTETAETVYTGETITFNASGSYDPDGSIVSYFWDFGDANNATGAVVTHAYADDGAYTVTLTVTDNDGATGTATSTKTVLNRPPIASFTESAETVLTGEPIYFNASASYDPDGSIVSYFWDFGDGTNASGVIVDHSYMDDGNYTVILTVTDDDGATDTATSTKTVLNRPPIASFTESAETVYTGDIITFNASESYDPDGYIVSHFWDFGDGTNATGVAVEHAYADDGNYTVTLTVTDDDGATDTATSIKTILNRPPVASFSETAETVYTNEVITFNASESHDSDGYIVSYFWDFGDGSNATGVIVEHAYADDGVYNVTLTTTDDDGATAPASATKTILNRSPVASFTESATTVLTGEVIYFNASASYDPDGYIVSYLWDFGDGTNATGAIVEHSYVDDGSYTVTLTVTDDDGATDVATATKTVLNRPPVASFTESAETVDTGETITFNASASYDPDGTIVSYFWDFGDGTNATGMIVDHPYVDDGFYNVTLTVTDDDGATDTATSTKTVLNRPPIATFTESATTVLTGEVIYFDASDSYDPDGSIVSYLWDFGDETNATGVVVEHAYADNGNYTVTLTVTDDDGATASTSATKTVLNRPPVAIFAESAETVYTNETITFNASDSYDPDGAIVSYHWNFGDGSNATGVVVDHSYADDGNYTVTLTVTDDDGATASTGATKTVLNRPPVASFTESAETAYTDEVITFNASDSYDPDGTIISYFWEFGDGTNATGVVVEHSYVDDGIYNVTLTVTDNDGSTGTATSTKTALNRPPVALFTESATTVLTNEVIYFNASESYDPDGSIVNYFWDFGDANNATGAVVTHAYADDGNYTVTLTVTDDDGATASTSATKTALNRPPVASFTESAETVYTGETITFNASGSYDPDGTIVSHYWDFGDGVNATGIIVNHVYAEDGNYTVTLTVTDDDGATALTTATKTVLNRPPVAIFAESAETVYTSEVISFNASESYDPDGSIVSYFWDFGDGINGTGVTVDHAYANDGNYTVTLTITDNDGASASASSTKTVLNRPPVASFTESAETAYTGETITFDASDSYDPDGSIVSYFWDFGDGTNATGVTLGHSYADNGNYMVTLTVTDNDDATGTSTATKTILNRSPVAIFTESATVVYTDVVIYFDASGSYDNDGIIVSYFWDFGDGTNATGVTVEHAYADDGSYVVTLTVTDDDGATGVATATKKVLNRPPVASFTESAETVYTSEIITFNASASYDPDGTIVSYLWDFGDGINASGMIVDHAYSEDGNYTVTLTVTDDDGATASSSATKTVLNRPPVASFTESAETVLVGEPIYFNASASYDPDGYIVSYFWDFGDGTNATGVTTEHAYADNGVYTVTLTITDDDGATASTTATKNVEVTPPVAIFTESAETVYTGEVIYFNASDSYDPDGVIVSYFWDFGDGTNATGVTVEHAYADDGNYTVTLTVTDDDGATDTATSTKTILNRSPVASFTESMTTVYTGEVIYFDASSSDDPDGSIVGYFWDFGDGTNATGATVEHAYADDGNYTVTLTVTDDDGATASSTAIKTVLNRPPVAIFAESAETVYTGETITFNASDSYDQDGTVVSYFWDFGDGTNATGVVVDHSYAEDGNYIVILTVTDDDGASSSSSSTKIVLNRPPIALFTESAETVYTAEVITFNASASYDSDGTVVSYFWDFGDGTNATGVTAGHAYSDDGNYTVTLTVTDDDGASGSTSAIKTVLNRSPVASFTESAETVLTGEVITFNASASYDSDGTIVSYFWDFGDGYNTTGVFVEHSYVDDGNYTVTLTVTDDDGATDTATSTKTVLNRPPVASFTESAETVFTGEVIYFNASASYDPDGVIVGYFWDFGDGTNATGVIVDHTYVSDGVYTVTLTVTDDDGATASTTAIKTVLNIPPVPLFTESAETVYTGETITFNASASYDPDGVIVGYFWDFGDGTNASDITAEHAYADDGTYIVTLTVTDDDDTTGTATSAKTVLNRPPVAIFTESAESVLTGEVIYFNASASYDPDGTILTYFWDFGDGTNATGVTAEHSYADEGNYTVTLTVTDDDGATASTNATKIVGNSPPVAMFTESAETVYTGVVISFDASESYDPDGTVVSYLWDFGDGTNATGVTAGHAYSDDGNYAVTLTVTDDDGATDTDTATKTILNRSPVATFTESATVVDTDVVIYFDSSDSYDPDGIIVSYFWDFGDGSNATGVIVEHAYADDGIYTVTLTTTDDDGATGAATSTKTVLNRPPVASFNESAETVYTEEVIYFNASASYDPDGPIVSYFWDFGDGTNTTGIVVNHAYADHNVYTVTLTVTDDDGATASASATKTVLNRPPLAIFTESAETVLVGEVIYFDASDSYDPDGTIVSYFWDFGDGTNATGVTVEHAYADNGQYTVTLTVTDDDGASTSTSATKMVEITPPVAIFTETAEIVYTSEVITFNASDSYDPDGTIVSYFWDFGDGNNATGVIVSHAYVDDGTYTVTLTVTDDDGATDTATSTKNVLNRPPVASFTESATTVFTGEVIYFNASASYDLDGTIVSYFWDFGDGTNATGVTVEHAYADDGTYTVSLTLTDDDEATDTTTSTKTALNRPPVALFTESAETVYTSEAIAFNASESSDPDGSIVSYLWDFGDGTNATGVTVEHSYANDGNYTVTLTITDDDGATALTSATKTVLNRPPVASFSESAESVLVGEVIYFNASASYDPDGTIATYFWNFGDGTNATGVTVEHAYADNGQYTVTLTVTDDDEATASTSATKMVEITPPVAIFTETAETVYTDELITFNASDSYDPDGFIVSYFWNFGDGTNATGVIVSHAYVDDGNYTVTLTVTDEDGATDIATSTKSVLNRSPVAIFSESAESVLTGEVIYFNASGSYDLDGTIVSYFWDFGDETSATGVIVEHSYADDGNYTVTLTVTDDDGATASANATKTILNRPPIATFTETAETVYTGEFITFNASESYDPDGVIVGYFWDFGDGTNGTGMIVDHLFAYDGIYTVTLTVTDDDGATGTTNSTKTVLNRPPVASFSESAETVLTSELIHFNASASYDPDGSIVGYFWDFGDGSNATGVIVEHAYADDGNYTVTLTVTDDDGASASTSATKIVLNRSPVASFTESATIAHTNEVIYFDASDSDDPDGVIVSYLWDFGDGTNATGVTVEHAYSDDGNYTVTLTVTDDDGATASASATKTILNRSPVALFTESAETVLTGEVIYFNASDSYDPDGYIVSYLWDFGDGTNATEVTTEHAYANDGVYSVTLTITDDDGATASTTATKTVGNSPPVAMFTESAETVLTGEVITFDASSSYDSDGWIVGYFWDFGDGTNATGVIVEHSYADDGNYTVTLTVTDDDGATSTSSATKTILNRPPVASFTESATTVYTGEIIYFDASSSDDPDGTIVSYLWDFGDGSNATGVTVGHAYTDDGNYTVTLTVTDDDGASASSSATKTALNRPPVASFIYSPDLPDVNETVTFNASDSYDPDGYIINYTWDFGDGNVTTVDTPTITHVYIAEGDYTVTLTVTDDDDATDIITDTVTVGIWPPVAVFTCSPESPIAGETVTFNASDSYDPDGKIVSYVWDFGDDNITTVTKPIITHIYSAAGNYTVSLTVTDGDGLTDTAIDTITVRQIAPVAVFAYLPDFPIVNETVTFNASDSYDSNGYITSYSWDFGDGNTTTVTDPIITHVYSASGNYTVSLTVTDNDGLTDTTTDIVRVRDYPTASFTYSPTSPYMGDTVTFDASSSVANGGVITSYLWDFGDESPSVNETDPTTTHAYDAAGNYTVTLTVTDSEGLSDTITETVTVSQAPVAVFIYSPDFPMVNETVTFNASDSYDPNGHVVSYVWKFGDGNITTIDTPIITHVYTEQGSYKVVLTVVDDDGYTDTSTATINVRDYPTASFTYSPDFPIADDIVTFNASSSTPNGGEITSYSWDFGDGNTTTVIDPIITHVYLTYGNYTVTLTVTDSEGLSDSESRTLSVRDYPEAAFTYTPSAPNAGDTVTFNASSSVPNGGEITSYQWDFGDGTPPVNETDPITTHTYTAVGNYTVTLTAADSEGLTDTALDSVMVGKPPVAAFTYSPDYPIVGETVTLDASDSYDPDGNIANYSWDLGDGNTTTVTSPIINHVYSVEGNYTVVLIVVDNDGLNDTATQIVRVRDYPTAAFTYSPDYPIAGETVTFNATSSSPNGGAITSYEWDFGDGNVTTATDPIIVHIYSAGGNYTVTLTVTDSEGLSDSSSKLVVVKQYPVASFTYSPGVPYVGDVVTFNASESYDPNGYITSFLWDFGDGTPLVNETDPITTHIYAVSGSYTATLIVIDNEGLNDTTTHLVDVLKAPVASFTYAPGFPIVNETVTFNASDSYDPNGYITSYTWDFGDGNVTTVTTPITTHAYSAEGRYNVTLTVTDNDGYTDTTSKIVPVRNHPTAAFTHTPDYPIVGQTVTFDASSSTPNGGTITSYSWDFGDGSNAMGVVVNHAYAAIGNYTVTLTVEDSEGLSDSESKTIRVREYPTAAFTYWPSAPYVGDTLTFNASSSSSNGGVIISYEWDFGDGNTTTVTTPIITYAYSMAGKYVVTLTVIDSEELSDTIARTAKVGKSPIALFTYTPEHPVGGEDIAFNASESYDSNGYIADYTWDFGDGNITTVTTPLVTHMYAPGTYTATLTVTDNDGYTDAITGTVKVRRSGDPLAYFTYSPDLPTVGETVTFNASNSYDPDGMISSYSWDFGDGHTTVTFRPIVTHSYASSGEYTVTLEVSDLEEHVDVTSKTVTVSRHPHAEFTWAPQIPQEYETVTFNASTSIPRGGTIISYEWDFGDGNITTVANPIISHSYETCGDYMVVLKVTDSEGLSETATNTITVGTLPVAIFIYSPDHPIDGETVTFNASDSYDPDGSINSYRWNFGDRNVTVTVDPIITHSYMAYGTYTVTLTAMDNDGLAKTVIHTVSIRDYPTAAFTHSPDRPIAGETVAFDASSSSPNGGIIASYEWDFGDGNITTVTAPTITHIYSSIGNYMITLTVTDSERLTNAESKTISVTGYPIAAFTFSPITPYNGDTVTFNASLSTPNGGVIISYWWDFGDGSSINETNPITTHVYTVAGNYTVSLIVIDSEGLTDTATDIITVNKAPIASFTYSPDFPIANETVTFNASDSYDPNGYITNYTWDFGDGNVTTVTTPITTHAYSAEGNYMVTLTVTDNDGYTDTTSDIVGVRNYPTAVFTYSPDYPIVGQTVTFDASSSTPNGGTITSYKWDFGDGNITTATDPVMYHAYAVVGNYSTTLNVTDSEGLWCTTSKAIDILPIGPTADFTWYPSVPRVNETVTFNASSSIPGWNGTHHPPIVSYKWDFGDGNTTTMASPIINHTYRSVGKYNITLTVTDSLGLEDEQTQIITVSTGLIGDINGDCKVDMKDIATISRYFGQTVPPAPANCDITGPTPGVPDGEIDMRDVATAASHFGETCDTTGSQETGIDNHALRCVYRTTCCQTSSLIRITMKNYTIIQVDDDMVANPCFDGMFLELFDVF